MSSGSFVPPPTQPFLSSDEDCRNQETMRFEGLGPEHTCLLTLERCRMARGVILK